MKKNGFRVATLFVVLVMVSFGSAKAQEAGEMTTGTNVTVYPIAGLGLMGYNAS